MDRKTEWVTNKAVKVKGRRDYYTTGTRGLLGSAIIKLARYEDTGLEPYEIQEAVNLVSFVGADVPQELKRWVERCTWHVRKCIQLQTELDKANQEISELRSKLASDNEPLRQS